MWPLHRQDQQRPNRHLPSCCRRSWAHPLPPGLSGCSPGSRQRSSRRWCRRCVRRRRHGCWPPWPSQRRQCLAPGSQPSQRQGLPHPAGLAASVAASAGRRAAAIATTLRAGACFVTAPRFAAAARTAGASRAVEASRLAERRTCAGTGTAATEARRLRERPSIGITATTAKHGHSARFATGASPCFLERRLNRRYAAGGRGCATHHGRTSHACSAGGHARRTHSRTDGGTGTEVANATSATNARAGDDAGDKRGTRLTNMSNATQKTSITPSSSKFRVPVFILA